ncbi:MAG TPA: alpha/beta hydrolase [Patescibacteria group bacterium]|jgi:pimeloyl-ACP methyl ester carboxylesterase
MPATERSRFVFVPGLGADGSVYKPFLDAFRSDYDVRSADSAPRFPERLSWNFFFSSIDRQVGTRPVTLVGHSMGGAIALKYAASHPERVAQVIAIAPVLFPFKRERHRFRESAWNAFIATVSGHMLHGARALRTTRRCLSEGRARKLFAFTDTIDLARDLPKLRQAVILFPEHEEVVPKAQLERVRKEFPNIRTAYIPGSHHHVALAPKWVITAVRKELDA